MNEHKPTCKSGNEDLVWNGSPNPTNPDYEWVCDECGAVISTENEGE